VKPCVSATAGPRSCGPCLQGGGTVCVGSPRPPLGPSRPLFGRSRRRLTARPTPLPGLPGEGGRTAPAPEQPRSTCVRAERPERWRPPRHRLPGRRRRGGTALRPLPGRDAPVLPASHDERPQTHPWFGDIRLTPVRECRRRRGGTALRPFPGRDAPGRPASHDERPQTRPGPGISV
jgi:hypothetical protein